MKWEAFRNQKELKEKFHAHIQAFLENPKSLHGLILEILGKIRLAFSGFVIVPEIYRIFDESPVLIKLLNRLHQKSSPDQNRINFHRIKIKNLKDFLFLSLLKNKWSQKHLFQGAVYQGNEMVLPALGTEIQKKTMENPGIEWFKQTQFWLSGHLPLLRNQLEQYCAFLIQTSHIPNFRNESIELEIDQLKFDDFSKAFKEFFPFPIKDSQE